MLLHHLLFSGRGLLVWPLPLPHSAGCRRGSEVQGERRGIPAVWQVPGQGGGGLLTAAARGLHHLGSRARLKSRPPAEGGVRGAEGPQCKVSNQISGLDLTLEHINGGAARAWSEKSSKLISSFHLSQMIPGGWDTPLATSPLVLLGVLGGSCSSLRWMCKKQPPPKATL